MDEFEEIKEDIPKKKKHVKERVETPLQFLHRVSDSSTTDSMKFLFLKRATWDRDYNKIWNTIIGVQ
ncbi:MAG: hypothetical protein KDK45_01995 [Leptospiraceae bacterium]|nr:hypothetical protein [Leptospiraceae bacterium]